MIRRLLTAALLPVFLISAWMIGPWTAGVAQASGFAAADGDQVSAGRKTVTAYADNETEAVARAQKANPGWTAISAKKVNGDPKSRAWQVTMTKD